MTVNYGNIKVPKSVRLQEDCLKAIEALMDCGGFWAGTKSQFAIRMDWSTDTGQPDRRRVEDMCNYTRDQDELPDRIQAMLGGMMVDYASNQGGMVLIDPSEDLGLHQHYHILAGDIARQRQHKTENRRRRSIWTRATSAAFSGGDLEMSKLCAQAEQCIESTGFLSDTLERQIGQVLRTRGGFQ